MTTHERDTVTAVVLAAGAGSRFGGGKLLATVDGRPVLRHVVDAVTAAGIEDVVVVVPVGPEGDAIADTVGTQPGVRIVGNPDPARGLSSSVRIGLAAVADEAAAALFVLGDQPLLAPVAVRALLDAHVTSERPVAVPIYAADAGRNPVLVHRSAFALVDAVTGDRGLGPVIAAHPDLVIEVPIAEARANPDIDTRDDLRRLLEARWAERVHANAAQVDRYREVPDGADFYAPVTGLFRADPRRTDEPALDVLLGLVEPGETWLDIGAGAGRYALPIGLALEATGGRVVAVDPSRGMLDALEELAVEHGVRNVTAIQTRWPPDDVEPFAADVVLIAHVSYDIADIGPFLDAMESAARRLCVAVLMERQPSSIADVCWPPVHGEARVALPASTACIELLRARGREPRVQRLEREPRRFASRRELEGFLRRQLWIEPGGDADARFLRSLDQLVETDGQGSVGLVGQQPLPLDVITWVPR